MDLEQQLDALPPRQVAIAGGAGIVVLGVLGAAYAGAKDEGALGWLRQLPIGLNGEGTVPAVWSGLFLIIAGLLAFVASHRLGGPRRLLSLQFLGVLFVFMGIDEMLALHERLENAVDVAWYILYAPLAAAGGIGWLLALRRTWTVGQVRWMLLGGAACWVVAQAIETQQYDGERLVHRWSILPEEMLEMTGSLLFVLALLVTVQSSRRAGTGSASLPVDSRR